MSKRHYAAAVVATLLLAASGSAQSAADLLQQGIHAQETVGNLDGAIAIFRQVVASPSTNKLLAAQAQYQLVLCLLQKGDRTGAAKEIQALEKNFPDQPDLLNKARQAMGPAEALLRAPWGEREITQLNIKRDGTLTGETLFYSVEPDLDGFGNKLNPQADILTWELNTVNTRRSVTVMVDRDTMRPIAVERNSNRLNPYLESNDALGDPAAAPLTGPATDIQESVFLMRRLPLAVGYKTTLTSLPFAIGQSEPRKLDLAVTGIEAVQTAKGKYNCYKVVIGTLGQTFWFNVDAPRALMKFQSGDVVAEEAGMWLAEDLAQSVLAPFKAAGWQTNNSSRNWGNYASGSVCFSVSDPCFSLAMTKIYTMAAEIPQSLQHALQRALNNSSGAGQALSVRSDGVRALLIGGQQALSCIADHGNTMRYIVLIQTENTLVQFSADISAVSRWKLDQILSAAKLP
jgi:tetratricopeptide (TPR) repeat protein